jgi:hypothetical protein
MMPRPRLTAGRAPDLFVGRCYRLVVDSNLAQRAGGLREPLRRGDNMLALAS